MANEKGPKPEADRLRERLLDQWEPALPSYLTYRKEIETMLENQEKRLRRERRWTTVMWLYIVALTTILMTGSGVLMIHKIEGTWMAVSAVLWFLFGTVFFFVHLINKSCFEVIKEIKGVELRLAALEERLTGRGDDTVAPN
jgi:undecaprenyl pyrophosphate phosphatase UppP